MIKQYFTDGLVQIAIVLSLLRTDVNHLLHNNYVNYPEVQEIIQGQTAVYTRTNFHNNFRNALNSLEGAVYPVHPKSIDREPFSVIIQDLRSLRRLGQWHVDADISTFLVDGSTGISEPEVASTSEDAHQEVGNHSQHPSSLTSLESETEIGRDSTGNGEELDLGAFGLPPNSFLDSEPTFEDLDLIDVLWRQDIDLGVGKEVFDINLRQELEREREIELQKERQKQKEREILQRKHEELKRQHEQQWLNDNFMRDGETGEWIPVGAVRVPRPPPPPAPDLLPSNNHVPQQTITNLDDYLSPYSSLTSVLGDVSSPEDVDNSSWLQELEDTQHQNQLQVQNLLPEPDQFNLSQHSQPGYNQNQPPLDQSYMGQAPHDQFEARQNQYNQTSTVQYNQTRLNQYNQTQHNQFNQTQPSQYHQNPQTQYSQNQPDQFNHTEQSVVNPEFQRQESLEQRWQDLLSLLNLSNGNTDAALMLMNASMGNTDMLSSMPTSPLMQNLSLSSPTSPLMQNLSLSSPTSPLMQNLSLSSPTDNLNHSSVLLQNATLPSPPAVNNSLNTFNNNNAGIMDSERIFNSSVPSDGSTSPLDWDQANVLFPNVTNNLSQDDSMENVDELLPDLLSEDGLDDITLADAAISEGLQSMQMLDEASSDSAVSMGSASSPAQDIAESMSPYDGTEGATGGQDYDGSPDYTKSSKYERSDYGYSGGSFSGSDNPQSNCSSSSNDTDFNGYHSPSHNHNRHVHHNHSYPLQPGQEKREVKKYTQTDKPRHKGPHSRDTKRAAELQIPFTVHQIVGSPVEEFNEMLSRHKLTEPQLQMIRDIRRRGKNKVAAQNCRKRKMDVIVDLGDELGGLKAERERLIQERHMIDKQTRDMRDKFGALYREIFHSLRDEQGHPYDPHQYSLQQSSDGNVFLVPRNVTSNEEEQFTKSTKKRKNEKK